MSGAKLLLPLVAAAIIGASAPCLALAQPRLPTLIMHGLEYPNACAAQELAALRASMDGVPDADEAWRAVHTVLCAPDDAHSRRYLGSLLPARVRESVDGSGQEGRTVLMSSAETVLDRLLAAGAAWNASVDVGRDELRLNYFRDEACVRGVTLIRRQRKWSVREIGEACD